MRYEVNLSYLRDACYEKHEAKKNKMSKAKAQAKNNRKNEIVNKMEDRKGIE